MNKVKVFKNEQFGSIRIMEHEDSVWFVGKDIAIILGYSNPSKAVSTHVDEDDKRFIMAKIADSQNGNVPVGQTKTALINESGLYSLILSSKLPKAKEFKHWVTSEVLPSIRKHGVYMTPERLTESLQNPDSLITILETLKTEQDKNKALTETVTAQEKELAEIKPKSEYCDRILSTPDLLNITEIAKDYGLSAKLMNVILHELKVIYYQHNTWLVYQRFIREGFAKNNTIEYLDKRGNLRASQALQWTQKGRLYIYNILRANGIYPLEEIGYAKLNDESELVQKCKEKLGHTSKFKAIPKKVMKAAYEAYKSKAKTVKSITDKLGVCYQTFYNKVEKYEANPNLAVY